MTLDCIQVLPSFDRRLPCSRGQLRRLRRGNLLFQTHFLNVWRRKWPSPKWLHVPKIPCYTHFFRSGLSNCFRPARPLARVTSQKNIPLQKLCFSFILRLQERAAGPV